MYTPAEKEKEIQSLLTLLEETSGKILNPMGFMLNPKGPNGKEYMEAVELDGLIREELDLLGYWDRFTTGD